MNNVPSIYKHRTTNLGQAAVAEIGSMQHPRLSIRGGRFTLETPQNSHPWPNLQIPIIIVGVNPHRSKVYYENKFDSADTGPPTCWSDNGIAPSVNATRKMSRSCEECEFNAFNTGGGISGKGKACADKKKIAVIVIGDPARETYELQIPPASLTNWAQYVGKVCSKNTPDGSRKADLFDVVTIISFVPDKVGILQFENFAWVDTIDGEDQWHQNGAPDGGAAIAARLDALIEAPDVAELVGANDKPWSGNYHGEVQLPSDVEAKNRAMVQAGVLAIGMGAGPPSLEVMQAARDKSLHGRGWQQPNPFAGPPGVPVSQPSTSPDSPSPRPPGRPPGAKNKPKTVMPAPKEALQVTAVAPGLPGGGPAARSVQVQDVPPFLPGQARSTPGLTGAPPPPSGIADAVRAAFALKQ